MRRSRPLGVVAALLIVHGASVGWAQPPQPASSDEQLLKQANLASDGPALLEFFRKRTVDAEDAARLTALIQQLGDSKPDTRATAFAELIRLGNAAVLPLRQAANSLDNLEAADQARRCLALIEGKTGASLAVAVARAIAQQRPPGAAAVLLAYLPCADDDLVTAEVCKAIAATTVRDGNTDPAVVRALEDRLPIRRAAAVDALCQAGGQEQRPALRKLLRDPKPTVRLRAALGLSTLHEEEAIPVLIDLLGELPMAQRTEVQQQLTRLAGEWTVNVPQGEDAVARRLRRELWATWWRTADGPMLLDELRRRTLSDAQRAQAQLLIQHLADEAPAQRDRAAGELAALGTGAIGLLRQALNGPDARIRPAAQKCLQRLESEGIPPLPAVVFRLLALRKPAGTAEAILAYLPCAESTQLVHEAQTALAAAGVREGKADPALLRALEDKLPLRRLAAAEALSESGAIEYRPALRKLLKDPDATMRLHMALLLAAGRDPEGIPVLIDLLAELPVEQAASAEEYLLRLAGDEAPAAPQGGDAAARRKWREAWVAWWRDKGQKIDLAKLDNPEWLLGQTLVVEQFEPVRRLGRILELDARGKVCWQIDGVAQPVDAVVLPRRHVLIAEQNGFRLTERDLKGTILWQRQLPMPAISVERLANGNSFVATRNQLLEIDPQGKDVSTMNRPNDVLAARKFADGQVTILNFARAFLRLDNTGKEVKNSHANYPSHLGVATHLLPDDHVLMTQYAQNKVAEYDLAGKVVWEAMVTLPTHAVRTASGTTLICSANGMRIVELDRSGNVVWEAPAGLRPYRARRR